jgi:hypothetical protein
MIGLVLSILAALLLTTSSFAGNAVASGEHSIAWTIGKNGVFVCVSDRFGNIAKCLNQTDPQKAVDTTEFQVLGSTGPFGEKASGAWLQKDRQLVLCSLDAAFANVVCVLNKLP